jgi:hypothetical protein
MTVNASGRNSGINCQVCGKLSGIPGMGFCFNCSGPNGPEWAQHESIAWLEHDIARMLKRDMDSRNPVEKQLTKKKPNKLRVIYY